MIVAEVLKPCTVTCQPGSVVEITEQQFRTLGDKVRYLPDDVEIKLTAPAAEPEISESVTAAGMENAAESAENVAEAAGVEKAVESVENVGGPTKKKAGRKKE